MASLAARLLLRFDRLFDSLLDALPPQHVPQQPACLPFLAVLGAWACFGSFAVPMKSQAVVEAKVHPMVFQTYKTLWTFASSLLVLLVWPFEFTWWGLASGFSWVPAGIAAVIAVQNVGIAVGQAIWQVTIIGTSFIWGFAVLQDERVYNWWGTALALSSLTIGMLGMTAVFNLSRYTGDEEALLEEDEDAPRKSRVIGISAAIFNGVWGGANLVPSHFSSVQGVHYVISFGIGALLANLFLLLLFCLWRKSAGEALPSPQFRTMLVPGLLSGGLWSAGNFCSLYVVASLGQGIGYSLVQASVVVSGLWGILYYRELTGHAVLYWAMACTVCGLGFAGLALEREPLH